MSPNVPDPYTYTPMHAAASYGQLHVLEYLVSRGGNVDVTDEDGDTPLYTIENLDTARWLVAHGANVHCRNNEGISPIEHLSEDFPQVATYLQSLSSAEPVVTGAASLASNSQQPSQHQQNIVSEEMTSSLMQSVQDIMRRAEAEGRDPDAELREVVGRTVLEGVLTGYEMTTDGNGNASDTQDTRENGNGAKRSRTDHGPGPGTT